MTLTDERYKALADDAARSVGAIYDIQPIEDAIRKAVAESLSVEYAKHARLVLDLDNAWEQFRRMRALLAETKYGDRLQNQVIAMNERQKAATDRAHEKWGTDYKNSKERTAFYEGYAAACEDAKGLVKALQACREVLAGNAMSKADLVDALKLANAEIKSWRGE